MTEWSEGGRRASGRAEEVDRRPRPPLFLRAILPSQLPSFLIWRDRRQSGVDTGRTDKTAGGAAVYCCDAFFSLPPVAVGRSSPHSAPIVLCLPVCLPSLSSSIFLSFYPSIYLSMPITSSHITSHPKEFGRSLAGWLAGRLPFLS